MGGLSKAKKLNNPKSLPFEVGDEFYGFAGDTIEFSKDLSVFMFEKFILAKKRGKRVYLRKTVDKSLASPLGGDLSIPSIMIQTMAFTDMSYMDEQNPYCTSYEKPYMGFFTELPTAKQLEKLKELRIQVLKSAIDFYSRPDKVSFVMGEEPASVYAKKFSEYCDRMREVDCTRLAIINKHDLPDIFDSSKTPKISLEVFDVDGFIHSGATINFHTIDDEEVII